MSFSGKAYRILVDLVYEHSRIRLGADKQTLLSNRLRKRLRALGFTSYDDYCGVLHSAEGSGRDRATGRSDLHQPHKIFSRARSFFLTGPGLFAHWSRGSFPCGRRCGSRLQPPPPARNLIRWPSWWRSTFALSLPRVADHCLGYLQSHARSRSAGRLSDRCRPTVPRSCCDGTSSAGSATGPGHVGSRQSYKDRLRFQRINLSQATYPVPRNTSRYLLSQCHDL